MDNGVRIFTKNKGEVDEMRCIGFYIHDPESVMHAILHFSSMMKNNHLDGYSIRQLKTELDVMVKYHKALEKEKENIQ